jgi:hypothetical protein
MLLQVGAVLAAGLVVAACGGSDGGSASTDAISTIAASCHSTIPDGGPADPCTAFDSATSRGCHLISTTANASGCKTGGWNSLVSADRSCVCCCY